tara:strand:- start:17046 stop:17642 length:597 start_codon:yes stop_codon:yes gene_type:complete
MKLQYKVDLLTNKLEYLRKEKEYCEELTREAMGEFHTEFMSLIAHLSETQKSLIYRFINERVTTPEERGEYPEEDENKDREIIKKETPEPIKKVFKQIAKKTHPDVATAEQAEVFQKAQAAVEEESYSQILQIAKELEIKPHVPTQKDVDLLEKEVETINVVLKNLKETYAWTWYHADSRDAVMERYIVKITQMCSRS